MNLVIAEEKKILGGSQYWGLATLNSEATLNSLSLGMIHEFLPHFKKWKSDPQCVGVFLQGAGEKAFCAGGDIKRLYQSLDAKHKDPKTSDTYAQEFFEAEYSLDYSIHTFPKPFIVWGNGIVMGGGLGLLSGASLKIVTESTKIAMPEITIGLFPDVGGSYFLNKVPGKLGLYLGLTGTRLNAADCLFAGLVDRIVKKDQKAAVIETLISLKYEGHKEKDLMQIDRALETFYVTDAGPSPLKDHQVEIEKIMASETPLAFSEKMKTLESSSDEWIAGGAKAFVRGCPTSAHVIWKQLHDGKDLPLKDCFDMELNIAQNIGRFDNFREGVRALLIDKDNKPAWNPASISDVKADFVNEHFKNCGKEIQEVS